MIEREVGDSIRLVFKYEKLGKFCFVCGAIGHTENFCNDKFESSFSNSEKKWGAYLRADNNSVGGSSKETNKWITGDRSKNSGGRQEEGRAINDIQSHLLSVKGNGTSNHKLFGRIKVGINTETRALTFFKYMECQWSDGTGLVRWWTEIDPTEIMANEDTREEPRTGSKVFAPNLTKSDKVNKVLAEGMNEKDEFLYANGGGAEGMWKLIELEAQQRSSPQCSKAGGAKPAARGKEVQQLADCRVPPGDSQASAHATQGQLVLADFVQQHAGPATNHSLRPLLQQSSAIKMTSSAYRKFFSNEGAPINVSLNNNKAVFQVQKVGSIQHLLPNDDQTVLSPMLNNTEFRAEFVSTKDSSSQPCRARASRKDKGILAVQHHGKPCRPTIACSPVQPRSFMASARGARAGEPQTEVGPKKRSRMDFAEKSDKDREGKKAMSVCNNPDFEKNDQTAGPGDGQACRKQ